MTQILFAAVALAAQIQVPATQEWDLKAPFKEKDANKYAISIEISMDGSQMTVDMNAEYKISKKTDKGFEGSFGWTELYVEGQQQDDLTVDLTLKPNGALKSVTSDYGPGMRRMLLPFFFTYPEKSVGMDGVWTYKDAAEDETDGHKATIDYKIVGQEKDVLKVQVKIVESGPDPMKADGHYWIGKDGKLLKFDLSVTAWTVPIAGQSFDAKLKGELTK